MGIFSLLISSISIPQNSLQKLSIEMKRHQSNKKEATSVVQLLE